MGLHTFDALSSNRIFSIFTYVILLINLILCVLFIAFYLIVGLILLFNGEGKLNGKRIKSGESVDEVGNYVLEIYGKDDVSYYHFSIEDMIITDKNNEYKPLEEVKTNTSGNLNNNLNGNKNNKPFNYEDSLEVNYSYVLIIVIIGLVIGLVPITKGKRMWGDINV